MAKYPRSVMTTDTESGTYEAVSNPKNPISHSINLSDSNKIPVPIIN